MEGVISEVYNERHEGTIAHALVPLQAVLGYGGGAARRFSTRFSVPRPRGSRALRVLVSIGVLIPRTLKPPLKWKLSIDGVTLSREVKPQVMVSVGDSMYGRMVIDGTPLLSKSFTERSVHNVFATYDAAHPITLADLFVVASYSRPEDRYMEFSASYHTGAISMEPGEVYKAYARLGDYLGGSRFAAAAIHVSNPKSEFELVAGGSRRERIRGSGIRVARVEVPYKGSEIPVAVIYLGTETPIYPRHSILGDLLVAENRVEGVDIRVSLRGVDESSDGCVYTLELDNAGNADVKNVVLKIASQQTPTIVVDRIPKGSKKVVKLRASGCKSGIVAVDFESTGVKMYREFRI